MFPIFKRHDKSEEIVVIKSIGENWQDTVKPGTLITKEVYNEIKNNYRVVCSVGVNRNKITPEYFQILTSDVHLNDPYHLYHTFDWDVKDQQYYIYLGMCFLGETTNRSPRNI